MSRWRFFILLIVLIVAKIPEVRGYLQGVNRWRRLKRNMGVGVASVVTLTTLISPGLPRTVTNAKDELPSLERCFVAVKRELDPQEGVSLQRLKKDIEEGDWTDLKLFTREYDAGFRGGVLKKSWKQLGDKKGDGIRISNSFTFDLIGLNQAARKEDKDEALKMYEAVRNDIVEFANLE